MALTRKAERRGTACLFRRVAIRFVQGNNNLAGPVRFGGGDVSVKLRGDDHWGSGSEETGPESRGLRLLLSVEGQKGEEGRLTETSGVD